MYEAFWRLDAPPFVLTPDVRFLLPAKSHHESLTALRDGVLRHAGVMVLTGDVGTGKTLLTRALAAEVPDSIETVLLGNPYLSGAELIGAILDELGVARTGASPGELMSALGRYLVAAGAAGKSVLLIVDEAQQMSVEALEQTRTLSTIELPDRKLLQVVLVGQPELEDTLGSRALRQLDQRVAVRARLKPLSARDTTRYVEHRLRVAGLLGAMPFTRPALDEVHRRSGGVPRLINLVCDRALDIASSGRAAEVTPIHVAAAARDLQSDSRRARRTRTMRRWAPAAAAAVAVLVIAGALGGAYRAGFGPDTWRRAAATPTIERAPVGPTAIVAATPPPPSPVAADIASSPELVPIAPTPFGRLMSRLLGAWGVSEALADSVAAAASPADAPAVARRHRLTATRLGEVGLAELRAIGLPAIVEVREPGAVTPYLVLAIDRDTATLAGAGGEEARVALGSLEASWTRSAWIVWRNPDGLPAAGEPWTPGARAAAATRLNSLGHGPGPGGDSDEAFADSVRRFQAAAGLQADGVLGPLTVLALARATERGTLPGLVAAR